MYFKQTKGFTDNFSYIIADDNAREAAIIDPSFNADEIMRLLKEKNLKAKYIINTHGHTDHTSGNEKLRSTLRAKTVAHSLSTIKKDISVNDGDSLNVGNIKIKVIHTPGHTPDGICLLADNKLFTGDTLFVGECGRTDLPGSSAKDMYHSLFEKVLKLDDAIEVWPGHDYGPRPHSTIGKERKTNYTLEKRSLEEFTEFMSQP